VTPEKRMKEKFLLDYYRENPNATINMGIQATKTKFKSGVSPNDASKMRKAAQTPKTFRRSSHWRGQEVKKSKQEYPATVIDISKLAPSDADKEKQVLDLALQISNILQGSNIKNVTIDERGAELSVLRLERKRQDRSEQPAAETAQS